MDLGIYVDNLRRQLAAAAEAGGPGDAAMAGRLMAPFESAIRLTLLDALSAAADEITRELAPGSVDLRLRGGEPDFVVTLPPPDEPIDGATDSASTALPSPLPTTEADEGATSRINLRRPDHLKSRIEAAADRAGLSVNSWLVRVAGAAVQTDGRDPDRWAGRRDSWSRQRQTGWVR
jgi:hypothetical protein